ncbi:MAG: hypothetical protein WCA94_02615 [Candidatus Acidiferrum sp.]
MKSVVRAAMLVAFGVFAPVAFAQAPAGAGTKDAGQPAVVPVAAPVGDHSKPPRVYLDSVSKGSNRNSDRDQSMEMSKDILKTCPDLVITINQQAADYTIRLNHIEHGLIVRDNQIQVFNKDGDLMQNKEGGSIKGNVKQVCQLIHQDWAR